MGYIWTKSQWRMCWCVQMLIGDQINPARLIVEAEYASGSIDLSKFDKLANLVVTEL